MSEIIQLNGRRIETDQLELHSLADGRRKISCDFKVTSDAYHDIAVLLYEMNFRVALPAKGQEFDAAISNYFTDTTNLYKGNEVADYHLELTELASN
ncbi:MAG: YkvR family protein [Planococcus sp. (in: firmicutes)]|nr:YkvR family protein [Planococcus sp. (in: firmicutes)]